MIPYVRNPTEQVFPAIKGSISYVVLTDYLLARLRSYDKDFKKSIYCHKLDTMNKNGKIFADFCLIQDLVIGGNILNKNTKTIFTDGHAIRHIYIRHMMNYIIFNVHTRIWDLNLIHRCAIYCAKRMTVGRQLNDDCDIIFQHCKIQKITSLSLT